MKSKAVMHYNLRCVLLWQLHVFDTHHIYTPPYFGTRNKPLEYIFIAFIRTYLHQILIIIIIIIKKKVAYIYCILLYIALCIMALQSPFAYKSRCTHCLNVLPHSEEISLPPPPTEEMVWFTHGIHVCMYACIRGSLDDDPAP